MIRIDRTILASDKTVGEFKAQGLVRFWVRGAGGTWPTSATVKLQEETSFEGETPEWVDQETWSDEGKHYVQIVPTGKYRVLASATGIFVKAETYMQSVSQVV